MERVKDVQQDVIGRYLQSSWALQNQYDIRLNLYSSKPELSETVNKIIKFAQVAADST